MAKLNDDAAMRQLFLQVNWLTDRMHDVLISIQQMRRRMDAAPSVPRPKRDPAKLKMAAEKKVV